MATISPTHLKVFFSVISTWIQPIQPISKILKSYRKSSDQYWYRSKLKPSIYPTLVLNGDNFTYPYYRPIICLLSQTLNSAVFGFVDEQERCVWAHESELININKIDHLKASEHQERPFLAPWALRVSYDALVESHMFISVHGVWVKILIPNHTIVIRDSTWEYYVTWCKSETSRYNDRLEIYLSSRPKCRILYTPRSN